MKELSIEQKAKAYDEALKVLKEKFSDKEVCGLDKSVLQKLFPQLKESEDERIWIINYLSNRILNSTIIAEKENLKKAIAWLEKQGGNNMGISEATKQKLEDSLNKALEKETPESWNEFLDEQKPANKVEPKFKVGDWIAYNHNPNLPPRKIIQIANEHYIFNNGSFEVKTLEADWHLWTIQDAKDGDMLAADPWSDYPSSFVAIYKKQNEEDFDSYCFVGFDGKFYEGECGHSTEYIHPATKEQRDLLFQKMKKAGYIWDSKNKKLKGEEVDNIHNYLYGEQSLVWSEEDEARFKSCIKILQPSDGYDTINTKWLKSLKERVQSQDIAYYNPYKEVVESIAEMCKHYDKTSHSGLRDFYDNVKVKCKDAKEYDSLFPQSTWKPSDEQIGVIEAVINNRSFQRRHLDSLYADLKRLREE